MAGLTLVIRELLSVVGFERIEGGKGKQFRETKVSGTARIRYRRISIRADMV